MLFVILFWGQGMQARHIIGGEVTYECLGVDTLRQMVTFEFRCIVYRDSYSGGAEFDREFEFGIYRRSGSGWTVHTTRLVPLTQVQNVEIDDSNPCVVYPPNVGVEKGEYRFTIQLPIINENYMVAFQRCCRNNTITNIYDPGNKGAAYTVEITPDAQRLCNNSPVFRSFPPIVICEGQNLNYDHGANDAEGDNLVYEFCVPLSAGGQLGSGGQPCPQGSCDCVIPDPYICLPPFEEVVFRVPRYTSSQPIPGNPPLSIDPISGFITGNPSEQGQFVVGVCVREYRNGVLLSTMRREFQFNVAFCEPTVTAMIEGEAGPLEGEFIINSCGDSTVEMVNVSSKKEYIETYFWQVDLGNRVDSFVSEDLTYTFPDTGTYRVLMAINREYDCADTAHITVNIFPSIASDFSYDYDTCVAGPVFFSDQSVSGSGAILDWAWSFGDGHESDQRNPNHLYDSPGVKNVLLKVTDVNQCTDVQAHDIPYFPVPPVIIVEPSTFVGCLPATVHFVNLSTPIDETYDIQWDFGDGGTSEALSPTHTYTEAGTYSVKIEITSPIGCYIDATYRSWIRIEPAPLADFTYTPEEVSSFDKEIVFQDLSTDASYWQWTFDDQFVFFDQNPTFEFQDTGLHKAELIVVHESGCQDTLVKYIDVTPRVTFYTPNAFTPNNDGRNDVFYGVGFFEGMTQFSLSIWNRWGERIFISNDPNQGWNGKKDNRGENCQEGMYVFKVEYLAPRGDKQSVNGFVTLIR